MKRAFPRRHWIGTAAAACAAAAKAGDTRAALTWRPSFLLASALYGNAPLADILPEVAKVGAASIDLWPRPHGTQREEVDTLGVNAVADLLKQHRVRLGGIACYRPGAFKLESEFEVSRRLGDTETGIQPFQRVPAILGIDHLVLAGLLQEPSHKSTVNARIVHHK